MHNNKVNHYMYEPDSHAEVPEPPYPANLKEMLSLQSLSISTMAVGCLFSPLPRLIFLAIASTILQAP